MVREVGPDQTRDLGHGSGHGSGHGGQREGVGFCFLRPCSYEGYVCAERETQRKMAD